MAHFCTRTSSNWSDISISLIYTVSQKVDYRLVAANLNSLLPVSCTATRLQVIHKILTRFIWNWTFFPAAILMDVENLRTCDKVTTASRCPLSGHGALAQAHWLFSQWQICRHFQWLVQSGNQSSRSDAWDKHDLYTYAIVPTE